MLRARLMEADADSESSVAEMSDDSDAESDEKSDIEEKKKHWDRESYRFSDLSEHLETFSRVTGFSLEVFELKLYPILQPVLEALFS